MGIYPVMNFLSSEIKTAAAVILTVLSIMFLQADIARGDLEDIEVAELSISSDGTSAPEKGATVILDSTFLFSSENAWLTLDIPSGIQIISGETSWKGNVREGEKISISAEIKANDTIQRNIYGMATVKMPGGIILTRKVILSVGRDKPVKRLLPLSKNSFGEKIIEYPAETVTTYR